jgi:ABC-type multidrug transport system fused ATPase/permease subunit
MRYRDGPLVLKNFSVTIPGCSSVGIAGRTGSGKSSLMVALFRIAPLAQGTILIDGVDIQKMPLNALRSKLGIIPQDPVMFSATIRYGEGERKAQKQAKKQAEAG